ncbi:hypothetical protein ACS0PU_010072 [Formica fusca]
MATIESLPYEILIMILEKISIKDIDNFSSTCKKFRQTSWGDKFWMKKLYQKWPRTRRICDRMTGENLKIDYEAVVKCVKGLYNLISEIPKDNLSETDKKKSMLIFLDKTRNDIIYNIIEDMLDEIMWQHPRRIGSDLTQRYYSYYIFQQLKYYHLKHSILKFRSRHRYHQLLEEMITLLVQWFNIDADSSYLPYLHIKTILNDRAEMVLQNLRQKYPLHSIFAMSDDYFNSWRNQYMFYTYWDYEELEQILITLEESLFKQSAWHRGHLDQLWFTNEDNESFVSRKQKIYLLAIYHAILRRVGIHSVVNVEGFKLRIYLKSSLEYIYAFHDDNDLFKCDFTIIRSDDAIRDYRRYYVNDLDVLCINAPFQVLQVESTLLNPWSSESKKDLQDTWKTDQDVTYPDILNIKWESKLSMIIEKSKPERRSAELKFVIGTIVSHKCTDGTNRIRHGVIVGWHCYFNSLPFTIVNTPDIKFCIYENCTDSTCLMHKPYYIILCDKDKYCYVQQENVSIFSSPFLPLIDHDEIGRYFYKIFYSERFYYVPNEMLARYYPCDVAIINEMMHNK